MRLRIAGLGDGETLPIGAVVIGATVGVVVHSRDVDFSPGDHVLASFGWQEYGVGFAKDMRKLAEPRIPLTAHLGCAGMPGVTAWMGLHRILGIKPGEILIVSAASGAVGGVAGQLAKQAGLHVFGVAGGLEKCRYVVEELGFDGCLDYKALDFIECLERSTPSGVDAYFDNVGGSLLDAVMARMNKFGRIAMCGRMADFDGDIKPMLNPGLISDRRLRIEGYGVAEQKGWREALSQLTERAADGRLKGRESVAYGLENAPEAFVGMLRGQNLGKQLVKLI
jgi:NADPH-dependent curcumin reductase CurA